jgi:hypothetical protein
MLGLPIALYYPEFDMSSQGGMEFSTEGELNYIVKIAASGNDVENLRQNTSVVIEDDETNQQTASILLHCTKGEKPDKAGWIKF